jgi:hypothetical protein
MDGHRRFGVTGSRLQVNSPSPPHHLIGRMVLATVGVMQKYRISITYELTLITGSAGVFDVIINDEMLYSKADTGRHAEPGEVLSLFTAHLPDDTPRYERG